VASRPNFVEQIAGLSAEQRARFERIVRRTLTQPVVIPTVPGPGPWPASLGQERMWVGADLAPAVNTYATGSGCAAPCRCRRCAPP